MALAKVEMTPDEARRFLARPTSGYEIIINRSGSETIVLTGDVDFETAREAASAFERAFERAGDDSYSVSIVKIGDVK